jgi:hypothetical protein
MESEPWRVAIGLVKQWSKHKIDVFASGMSRMTTLEAWFSAIKSFWDYRRLTQQ